MASTQPHSLDALRAKFSGRINPGIREDYRKQADAMQRLFLEWDPVGHTKEEVEFVVGEPMQPLWNEGDFCYAFDSGFSYIAWRFRVQDGRVISVERMP